MSRYIDADTMIKAVSPIMEWLSKKAPTIDIDLADDGTLSVKVDDATKVKRVLVEDGKYGNLYYADRPKSEWRHDGSVWTYRFNCTNCGYHLLGKQTNYCPSCGAKMKGADDE